MKKNIFLASLLFLSVHLEGKPKLDHVAHGKAVCKEQGHELLIEASDKAILNFHSFDIQKNEAVRFRMEDVSHRVLNRIHSRHPSQIEGKLTSNGIVYLLNPAGVVFGPQSIVNVASLVVAAAHLSDQDFLQGHHHFERMEGAIKAFGKISAEEVILAGTEVHQHGKVDAKSVIYAVGNQLYLGKEGEHLFIKCDKEQLLQKDDAPFLASGSAEGFLIHHTGVTNAKSIHLYGEKGSTTQIAGKLDASDFEGTGGKIVVQGETVQLQKARLDASGALGGGTIFVGGGKEGKGIYPTSTEVDCDFESSLVADAFIKGNGGTIVQWADQRCKANGDYSTKEGFEDGFGGEIETSSGNLFQALTTRVNPGRFGAWKLDPYSIQILDGSGSATIADLNDGSNNSYIVNSATINAALANTTVIFAANNSSTHTPGTCSIALGTPGTPANINTTNANVTLIFNTTESPTIRGNMTTNGSIQSGTIVFSTPITLTGDTSLTATGAITLNFDINGDGNGPWNLSMTAPAAVICQGSVGTTNPVKNFTVVTTPTNTGSFLAGNTVLSPTWTAHATEDISMGAVVSLQAPASFLSDGGGLEFFGAVSASTPTAQQNLTLSGTGNITFHDTLGLNPLGDILIQNAHDVTLLVSPAPLSSGIPPHFIRGRSFTQLNGTGSSNFQGSIYTSGVPIISRNPPQNGGAVYIKTAGDINFYYLVNVGGFATPMLSVTLPTRPFYKSVIDTTGGRASAPGSGFSGGNVTLIGNSVNLLGAYAGGTPAFPGSSFTGGKGGDVVITTTAGLNLRGPIFATGGAGINGGGQVLPTLIFSGQNLNAPGPDSAGNITITGPTFLGFNGVVLRGQNIQGSSFTGLNPDLLTIDGSTNGKAQLGALSNLSYFVVDYSEGVTVNGVTQAQGLALFNAGPGGIVFQGPVTSQNITAIKNQFAVTFAQGSTAAEVALLNCGAKPPPPPPPPPPVPPAPTVTPSNNLGLAGAYSPASDLTGALLFDTATSLFSTLILISTTTPFVDVLNLGDFSLNYLTPSEVVPELNEFNIQELEKRKK